MWYYSLAVVVQLVGCTVGALWRSVREVIGILAELVPVIRPVSGPRLVQFELPIDGCNVGAAGVRLADVVLSPILGMATKASAPRISTTTMSSTRVKALAWSGRLSDIRATKSVILQLLP